MQTNLTLEDAFAQMAQAIELELLGQTYKQVQETSREIAKEVQLEYDYFFHYMVAMVIGAPDAPDQLARYLPDGEWADISLKWNNTKNRVWGNTGNVGLYNQFYRGISNAGTMANSRMGRGKKGSSGKKTSVKPFGDYIKSLQTAGTVEKFFGPVSLQYEFESPQIGHVITAKMGGKTIDNSDRNDITRIFTRNTLGSKKGFVATPDKFKITATVSAFDKLKGIGDTEFALVDFIIRQIDPGNRKQWVKINGRYGHGRSHRPIRAVIQPMIHWYFEKLLPAAMKV